MDTKKLKYNPNNPRKISPDHLDKLKKSIQDFPEMMRLRPIVYDPDTMHVLGGNQRLSAIKALGMKEIPDEWAVSADKLTEQQKKEFILKDNIPLGEWDFAVLEADFAEFDLTEIGIESDTKEDEPLLDEKGKEIKAIKQVHFLITVPLDCVIDVKNIIDQLKNHPEIEVEQSQN